MNSDNSQTIKYSVLVLLLVCLGVIIFFVFVNKIVQEVGDKEKNKFTAEEAREIRAELSKPPDVVPKGSVIKADGTVEFSEAMKAKIRSELKK